jgi:hypothetical protein
MENNIGKKSNTHRPYPFAQVSMTISNKIGNNRIKNGISISQTIKSGK